MANEIQPREPISYDRLADCVEGDSSNTVKVKLHRIWNLVLTGEWINNKKINDRLQKDIDELAGDEFLILNPDEIKEGTSLTEYIENRKDLIANANKIKQMKAVINLMGNTNLRDTLNVVERENEVRLKEYNKFITTHTTQKSAPKKVINKKDIQDRLNKIQGEYRKISPQDSVDKQIRKHQAIAGSLEDLLSRVNRGNFSLPVKNELTDQIKELKQKNSADLSLKRTQQK